jgi:hypothetical protein
MSGQSYVSINTLCVPSHPSGNPNAAESTVLKVLSGYTKQHTASLLILMMTLDWL